MAGMAAMFAGFGNAPLAAALMIVELTGQYNLLFPMLICSLIASKIAEFVMHESIYHQNLNSLLKKTSANLTHD
jgi:CIC family chloride channel protein